MGTEHSKAMVHTGLKDIVKTTTALACSNHSQNRVVQNYLLLWVDANIEQSIKDCQQTLTQLRSVVNEVNTFTDTEKCIQFLQGIDKEKVFMIVSGSMGRDLIPRIHDLSQLDVIYVFCANKSYHEEWSKDWNKVKGIYTNIEHICKALSMAGKQCNEDATPVGFLGKHEMTSGQNLNEIEPSFMYTQLFKEILVEMQHNPDAIKDMTRYCRKFHENNKVELSLIDEFEQSYRPDAAIWWYTRDCFTYKMLNRALRLLECDTIINMGFYLRDLHLQIEELYQNQLSDYSGKSFLLYRGQGLPQEEFEKLCKTAGGLMSFSCFLSTSKDRVVSLNQFAEPASKKTGKVGVLFVMSIDPTISSARFAAVDKISFFKTEKEVLFSMHTVFRIGEITQLDKNKPLFQVEFTLTADDDPLLHTLTNRIREDITGSAGWHRMGSLLLTIDQYDKAEELFNILLKQASNKKEEGYFYNQLGLVKCNQGDYQTAIHFYEKSLESEQTYSPPDDPSFATTYNNMGGVYSITGEYSKELSFYQKALEIRQKSLPANHPDLANSYSNIGSAYFHMGEYSKALASHEKTLKILQETLPSTHPYLAISCSHIGGVYETMGEYSKALSFYQRALEIRQKSLPSNHPDLALSYSSMGSLCNKMGEYSKALALHEKSLEIKQKALPPDHPALAITYSNIGSVHSDMKEYSKALSFYEKSRAINEKTFSPDHPHLATDYNNIGSIYFILGEYSKALSFQEKALGIKQKTLPADHPDLATIYNNIGGVYFHMREYSKAISLHEKACGIQRKNLPSDHLDLAHSYVSIGLVYEHEKDYPKALSYFQQALDIRQRKLSSDHPDIQQVQGYIEDIKQKM